MEKIPKEKIVLIPEVDTDVVSDLAPFNFTVERDKLLIDDSYAVPYVITKYNNKPRGNWFNRIRKMSGDITISHYYTKANGNSLNDYYNRTIKNKQAEIDRSHDPLTIIRLEREMKIAQTQLEQAVDENTSYLYLYTYVLIKSRSEDKLKKLCEDFETRCIASGVKALIPYTMIDKAYWSALPLQSNEVPEYTYTIANSISASSIFPFDDNELSVFTKNMMIEGINKDTENIVSIDYTNRKLVVNRNKFVFGLSGGGKTTLLQIILGITQPINGCVKINEILLSDLDKNNYYSKIAYIPQKTSIFEGSILENLVLFKEVNEKKAIDALISVGLQKFVSNNKIDNYKLSSKVSLSGGEERRLDIARGLYSEAEVFVFDEPTSGVDNENENVVSSIIQGINDKIVIVVTHSENEKFLNSFDKVLSLENGQLIEIK